MRNIGFDGGHSVYELGPTSDVVLFFDCINAYPVYDNPEQDWSVLTDRLYKRYLRHEELDVAAEMMNQVKLAFAQVPSSNVKWIEATAGNSLESSLDSKLPSLADVFGKYFETFVKAKGSAESFFDAFKIYQPVRIVVADIPEFMIEKKRPLQEYDFLDGKPFWLR